MFDPQYRLESASVRRLFYRTAACVNGNPETGIMENVCS